MEESHKEFHQGFQIDATTLAGIVSMLDGHLSRVGQDRHNVFKVHLKDGSAQTLPDANSVSALQNVGNREIVAIEYAAVVGGIDKPSASINVIFSSANEDYGLNPSVKYSVKGPDREWVRSAQVDVDEFVQGISRANVGKIVSKIRPFISAVTIILLFIFMFLSLKIMSEGRISSSELSALKSSLGGVTDVSVAIYRYAEWSADAERDDPVMWWLVVPMLSVMIIGLLQPSHVNKIFKSHIFYTGGMVSIVNQRRSTHAVVWIGIVLALIVGLVVNYLSKFIV